MLFQSLEFLLLFPAVCLIYYIVPAKWRFYYLTLVSFLFYLPFGLPSAALLLAVALGTYLCGRMVEKKKDHAGKLIFTALGVTACLGVLFFFKYLLFALEILNKIGAKVGWGGVHPSFELLLPVGISFYIFTAIGYLIDVYRGSSAAEKNVVRFILFLSFFPKMVQGPIERSTGFLKQLEKPVSFRYDNIWEGFLLMVFGFFQKLVIADQIAILVDTVFVAWPEYEGTELLVACLLFAMQIYCDFCGYTNIARGAARIMGFELTDNFNTPYMAVSVADFWRRWHISLTSWFRDYLYIPLGGNRHGKIRKYSNILIVFLFSGLWHGAAWHYVAWGGLNGLFQIAGDLTKPVRNKMCSLLQIDRNAFSHKLLKGIVTFVLIDISWVFFRANSIHDACTILKNIFTRWSPWVLFNNKLFTLGLNSKAFHMVLTALLVQIVTDILHYNKTDLVSGLRKQGVWLRWLVLMGLMMWTLVCGAYGKGFDIGNFIYMQF